MIDPAQFLTSIIRPALEVLDLGGTAAEELLLGTAIQESRLTYLRQLGNGPALGVFQMEPATHDSLWEHFLKYRGGLASQVRVLCGTPSPMAMVGNLWYAAAMARIKYFADKHLLPAAGDLAGQATYWKRVYNTRLGKGTEAEYIKNWTRVMGAQA